MRREAFIKKWLGNREKQYTEQFMDEMRDDLDLVEVANIKAFTQWLSDNHSIDIPDMILQDYMGRMGYE
jgi:hypothetical protein